jgi:hypothetical protein
MKKEYILIFLLLFCINSIIYAASENPFAVMLSEDSYSFGNRLNLIEQLQVKYVRPAAISVKGWPNNDRDAENFSARGFKLVITVRNAENNQSALPIDNITGYKNMISQVLDEHKPALLLVEDEETSLGYYKGSPDDYLKELQAACSVAHSKNMKCANGGLSSNLLALLVWDDYFRSGDYDKARSFLMRACTPWQQEELTTIKGRVRIQSKIDKGKAFLDAYRNAGPDYVNFHWYIDDSQAFKEAVAFLERTTGLVAVTDEMGMIEHDLPVFKELLEAIKELELPIVVWFSAIDPDTQALQNADFTLNDLGYALKQFIIDNYSS